MPAARPDLGQHDLGGLDHDDHRARSRKPLGGVLGDRGGDVLTVGNATFTVDITSPWVTASTVALSWLRASCTVPPRGEQGPPTGRRGRSGWRP
jgi:hypothetical protein